MKIRTNTDFSFIKLTATEVETGRRAATSTVKRVSGNLKNELRRRTRKAGLGTGLEKAWDRSVYPRRGRSMSAAGFVYSKAKRLHGAFATGATVRAEGGGWLVIPTREAERRGYDKSKRRSQGSRARGDANVRAAERDFGYLRFVKYGTDKAMLYGFRGDQVIPLFTLVKQVRMPKLIDPDAALQKWSTRLPKTLEREFSKLDRKTGRR